MQKKTIKALTILELLVVIAIIGVFSVVAYPNISKWITDRDVKKEVYETINYIKEMKVLADSGQYGIVQLSLKPNLEVYTMSNEDYFNTYKSISTNNSFKRNYQCSYGTMQNGFQRNTSLESLKLSVSSNDSSVHVYPNAAHNPTSTVLCLTKDNSISYMRLRKTERDPETGQNVDIFVFCSKSNSTQYSCKYDARLDFMYKITINKNVNIKIFKLNKTNGQWKKIDG